MICLTHKILLAIILLCSIATNAINFDDVDKNKDGKIQYQEFVKFSQNIDNIRVKDNVNNLFVGYDSNRDGSLSVEEFVYLNSAFPDSPISEFQKFFNRLDTNKDGYVTVLEATTNKDSLSPEIINGLFQFADVNNDKMISLREMAAVMAPNEQPVEPVNENLQTARRLMAIIDQNSDRKLTVEELLKYANQYNQISGSEISAVFNALDTNKDGYLVVLELVKLQEKLAALNAYKPTTKIYN
uniref:EF-hand domain pair-containing protein n=1 Tax=Rhabditophanes sp. KR3021 TaxID=114890 RepID=A0AC35U9J9_9BILA